MNLHKIVVPIITPFDKKGNVYEKGVVNLIQFLYKNGIRSLWVLGSYGSFPLMSERQRMEMADISVSVAHEHNMTAIVQVGTPSVEKSLLLAKHAEQIGADGLASVVPFYYSSAHYAEKNFLKYFKAIINSTGLPLFFYNNPRTTGYNPTLKFVEKLIDIGVVGIKDTVTDFISIVEKICLFDKLKESGYYLGGSSSVYYPTLAMGARGVVCGTAVAIPEIILGLQAAIDKDNIKQIQKYQKNILRVRAIQGKYVGRSVACYDVLAARGIDVGTVKPPWKRMTPSEVDKTICDLNKIPGVKLNID